MGKPSKRWEYFNQIIPSLRDMIDNHKAKGEWKIQIVMRIIFVSFIDANETQVNLHRLLWVIL